MSQRSPKVSVVITAFNSASFIRDALQSVADQTYRDFEIIVVDDGSEDDTGRIVKSSEISCKYIYQENQGASAARNTGLRAAGGEYINFLDADDLLLPDKLFTQVAFLDSHTDVDIVYGDTVYFYQDGTDRSQRRFSRGLRTPPFPTSGNMLEVLVINSVFAVHAALVRRSCMVEIGGFDEHLRSAEDYDLWLRMAACYRFFYVDEIVVKYRIHGKNKIFVQPTNRLKDLNQIWDRVSHSDEFQELPSTIKSEFYLRVATDNVVYNSTPREARIALREAITCNPRILMPYLMLFLLIFGNKPLRAVLQFRKRLIRHRRLWRDQL